MSAGGPEHGESMTELPEILWNLGGVIAVCGAYFVAAGIGLMGTGLLWIIVERFAP